MRFQEQDGGARCNRCDYGPTSNPDNGWSPSEFISDFKGVRDKYRNSELNLVGATACALDEDGDILAPGTLIENPSLFHRYDSDDDRCTSIAAFDIRSDTALEAGFNIVKTFFVMFMMAPAG